MLFITVLYLHCNHKHSNGHFGMFLINLHFLEWILICMCAYICKLTPSYLYTCKVVIFLLQCSWFNANFIYVKSFIKFCNSCRCLLFDLFFCNLGLLRFSSNALMSFVNYFIFAVAGNWKVICARKCKCSLDKPPLYSRRERERVRGRA